MLFLDRDEGGFTLMEIMFAVFILAIALVGLAFAFSQGSVLITELRQISIATQAAQEEMELIRDMAFDNILTLGSSFTATGFGSLNNPLGILTVDDPYATSDMRRVTVTVTWTSVRGRTLNRSLVTLVTRDGINRQ